MPAHNHISCFLRPPQQHLFRPFALGPPEPRLSWQQQQKDLAEATFALIQHGEKKIEGM